VVSASTPAAFINETSFISWSPGLAFCERSSVPNNPESGNLRLPKRGFETR